MQQRIVDNVGKTMADMQEQEGIGHFHNFCRMASEDFDYVIISDQRQNSEIKYEF